MTKLKTHLIALAGIALVAFAGVESPHYGTATFLVGLIGVATVGALFLQIRGRLHPTIVDGQLVRSSRNLVNTKRILIAFMALGIAAYVGGGGTFSTFNAETSNPGSGISSGTLTMTDQVNSSANVCATINAYTQDNDNSQPYNSGTAPLGCEAALALTNLAPGGYDGPTGASMLTLKNTGSLDASKFYLYGSYVNGVLSTGLTSGATPSTITVASLEGPVTSADTIKLSWGTHAETCVAGASTAASSTTATITLSSCDDGSVSHLNIYNYSYPSGTRVLDSSSDTSPTNTDCWDAKTTTPPVSGATKGTDLNFNPTTGNPMCTSTLFWVQEQTNGKNYCWYGLGSQGGAQLHSGTTSEYNGSGVSDHVEDTLGMCAAPISALLTATSNGGSSPYTVSAATTSLTFAAGLTGNIKSGDTLQVTDKTVNASARCTATQNVWLGTTVASQSVTVSSCGTLVNNTAFTTGHTYVTDVTTASVLPADLSILNGDSTDTISNFDTAHSSAGEIQLYPLTSNGVANTNAAIELNRHGVTGDTRIFWVGVYLPSPSGTGQNQLQGLMSTFGFNWHIDQ